MGTEQRAGDRFKGQHGDESGGTLYLTTNQIQVQRRRIAAVWGSRPRLTWHATAQCMPGSLLGNVSVSKSRPEKHTNTENSSAVTKRTRGRKQTEIGLDSSSLSPCVWFRGETRTSNLRTCWPLEWLCIDQTINTCFRFMSSIIFFHINTHL